MLITIPNVCAQCVETFEVTAGTVQGDINIGLQNRARSNLAAVKITLTWCSVTCAFAWLLEKLGAVIEESDKKSSILGQTEVDGILSKLNKESSDE